MRKKQVNIFLYIITLRWIFEGGVLFYKKCMSPLLPSVCIYNPTCSTYMLACLKKHGVIKGTALGIKRIARCVPWAHGGYDPIPNKKSDLKWLF